MTAPDYVIRVTHAFFDVEEDHKDIRTKKQRMHDSAVIISALEQRGKDVSEFVEVNGNYTLVPNEFTLDCRQGQIALYNAAYRAGINFHSLGLYFKEGLTTPQRWFEMYDITEETPMFTMEEDGLEIISVKH